MVTGVFVLDKEYTIFTTGDTMYQWKISIKQINNKHEKVFVKILMHKIDSIFFLRNTALRN